MNKLNLLSNIILNEAPLSSYVKGLGRGVGNVAKFGARAAGTAVGSLYDPYGGKAQKITQPVSQALQKLGQPSMAKDKSAAMVNGKQQQQAQSSSNIPTVPSKKDKVDFYINNRKYEGKVIANLANNLPVVKITGINNIQSMVIEPKGKGKALLYFYKEKVPKRKSQPIQFRPGQMGYFQQIKKWIVKTK